MCSLLAWEQARWCGRWWSWTGAGRDPCGGWGARTVCPLMTCLNSGTSSGWWRRRCAAPGVATPAVPGESLRHITICSYDVLMGDGRSAGTRPAAGRTIGAALHTNIAPPSRSSTSTNKHLRQGAASRFPSRCHPSHVSVCTRYIEFHRPSSTSPDTKSLFRFTWH